MSYHDTVHVQKALKVLCNVPKEAFLPHRTEALLAFQKLRTVVGDDGGTWTPPLTNNHSSCSPPSEDHSSSSALMVTNKSFLPALAAQGSSTPSLNGPNSSSTLPNTTDTSSLALHSQGSTTFSIQQSSSSPSLSGHELSPTPPVLTLTQALDKDSAQIQEFLSRPELEAIEDELERIVEDPRVVDLQLDGSRSTPKARFRKGLSQRSLAIDYTQWERHTYGSSKVSVLVKDLSVSQERGLGHIVEYLESNNRRFKKQDITRRGIEHGIKFLVFELLVGTRVISAILSFKYSLFRAVKFEDLPFLKTMMNDSEWIKELVEQKADWYDECQTLYDVWCKKLSRTNKPYEPCSSPSEPWGKRRRLNQDINLPQFDCPSDAQLSQYQDTSQSGNRVLSTARDMVNGLEEAEHSHRDAEHFRTQTHEGVFSRPSQWEDAAALMPLASSHQQSGPEAYSSGMESNPPTGQAFFTTEVGVQGLTNLGMNSYTPTRLPTIAARPSLEETRSYERERTQRSPALRLPSLRHLIHTNPPNPSSNNFSSGEYDGPRVTTDGSIATPGTAHQHSSHFIPASLQRNPTNTAYGSPPGQNLQYACQLGVPPNPQEGERNPQSNNLSAAEYTNLGSGSGPAAGTGNYVPWFPESDDAFDAQAHAPAQAPGLSPDAGFGASTGNYVPWFPESDDMSGAKASDVNLDAGFGANTNNYVPWFAESEGMSGAEAPSVNPDAGLMAGNGNYVPWVPDIENGLAYHMR